MTETKPAVQDEEVVGAYTVICDWLRQQGAATAEEAENFADTPQRAARALREIVSSEAAIKAELSKHLDRVFPTNDRKRLLPAMTHGSVPLVSMCPHHLMIVEYDCFVSYFPKPGKVLGISKLSRVAQIMARRPVLQEQLCEDIADVLFQGVGKAKQTRWPALDSGGSAVYLRGRHTCQSCRGVRSPASTSCTAVRGDFVNPEAETRFFQQIQLLDGK